ncbi:SDR family oxidoreductase [Poritiphilus flavus]|uniref:SDR family oxidoreductase n=1 Tax=Poritiphilus flavus TaxID=2697053 RepID=A0A6L9EET3_9FLAO|nr:SDR family oxidoreductase [Poritiphilus flavus]NAS13181.1 SDR family oxidoreductase [Poritiphilus flavus]
MAAANGNWAIILGGSRGLGLATARKLAKAGFSIFIVHRDRRADMEEVELAFESIRSPGVRLESRNVDALKTAVRQEIVSELKAITIAEGGSIGVLVHSIAKGSLKPMIDPGDQGLNQQDFMITLDAMAVSLYDWTKEVFDAGLASKDMRIISFTSEGNQKAIPNYAAVSAAKAALEAITRNIALEFAPLGVKANCIQAGVTDTWSFNQIPGSEMIRKSALRRNPNKRLTTPEDIANVAYLLCLPEAAWITGTVIKADGGESLL